MTRKACIICAVVLAYAAIEIAGYLLWPTACSRCAPLPASPTPSSFPNLR